MGTEQNIIVALEFGSYAICGIAGQRKPDGTMKVLGLEIEKVAGSVRRGVIYNIDTTTTAISNIVNHLSDKLKVKVTKAYVGISGQSLHTEQNVIKRNFETKLKVTTELTDNLKENNIATEYKDFEILDVIPQEFIVGHHTVIDPVGIQTESIEARYVNVIARKVLQENIRQCMQKAKVEIADIFISPIALADKLLTDSEKRSGCALADFGAGTTTVSVYTSNMLRSLVVIPLGGNNITTDLINSKQLYQEEAEGLKRKNGIAYVAADTEMPQTFPINNNRTIDENELQSIIGARQEEIIANVWNQIEEVSEKLLAGIIITGGAALIKDMTEAIKHHTDFDRVKVAKSLVTLVEVAQGVNTPQDVNIDTLIALLMHGTDSCVEKKVPATPTPDDHLIREDGKTPTPQDGSGDDHKGREDEDNKEEEEEEEAKKPWWRNLVRQVGRIVREAEEEEEDL